jgi:exocyst complex protein 7
VCFVQEEYRVLGDMLPLSAPAVLVATYNSLLGPVVGLFGDTLTSLIGLIKRSLHKYTFLALSTYQSLSVLQTRWDVLQGRRGAGGADGPKKNELRDGLNQLRAVCLRSFPEFLADVKMAGTPRAGELSTGVAELAIGVSVVNPNFVWGLMCCVDGQVFAEGSGGERCGGICTCGARGWELEDG